jgi:ADP-ribosylarginine hydrolase
MESRYYHVMLLHALGDTIGFKNGAWEFNNYVSPDKLDTVDYVNEMIYEFIELGGVNGIDLTGWKISDDTILHIAMARAMIRYNGQHDKRFVNKIKNCLKREADVMENEEFDRVIGLTTRDSIELFAHGQDARDLPYDMFGGGNGAAMRTLCVGMCLYKEVQQDQMIWMSVVSSQLTHNNSHGYLGGFNAALFVALAMRSVPLVQWPMILVGLLGTSALKQYNLTNTEDEIFDQILYSRYWKKYIDTKFDQGVPIRNRAFANPMHRIRYFHDNFHQSNGSSQIGGSGYLCMIMAYDALLDCDGKWEKLICYAMLHSGDSDTIGAVAGGLYGAVYGMGDVPPHMLEHIERKQELKKLAKQMYKKYGDDGAMGK